MSNQVMWVQDSTQTKTFGLLGSGFRITMELEPDGWSVTFGTATLQQRFAHEAAARAAGIGLARRILTEILTKLEE